MTGKSSMVESQLGWRSEREVPTAKPHPLAQGQGESTCGDEDFPAPSGGLRRYPLRPSLEEATDSRAKWRSQARRLDRNAGKKGGELQSRKRGASRQAFSPSPKLF